MNIVSADDYFMCGGQYVFEPWKLPQAHAQCLMKFLGYIQRDGVAKVTILRGLPGSGKSHFACCNLEEDFGVVVDNTNLTRVEIAPYAAIGLAHGCDTKIITLNCDVDICRKRQKHGVPDNTFGSMWQRMIEERNCFPPWWTHMEYNWDIPSQKYVKI